MFEPLIQFVLRRWEKQLLPQYTDFCKMLSAFTKRTCTLGILSLQSAGKTTLINACLGYPILPALLTKGTVCPVHIRWGNQPSLAVRLSDNKKVWEVKIPDKVPEPIFSQLLEYICLCVNLAVFYPENLSYFMEEEKGMGSLTPQDIHMDPQDTRHILLLVLIVLNAHMESSGHRPSGAVFRQVSEARQNLLKQFGLDGGEMELLRLSWNSPMLENGLCLVDLPGLGSGSMANGKSYSLDEIASEWAKYMDVLLCMTTKEVVGGQMQEILEKIYLDSPAESGSKGNSSMKKLPLPMLVVNKAEDIINPDIVIHAARQLLWFLSPSCCLISAAAGEQRYLEENIPIERTRYWRNIYLPEHQLDSSDPEISEKARIRARKRLSECYTRKYDCAGSDGSAGSISLKEFIENTLPEVGMYQACEMFRSTCQGHLDAIHFLGRLTKKEMDSLSAMYDNSGDLWEELRERTEREMSDLQEACRSAEHQLRCAETEYQKGLQLFRNDWIHAVEQLNRSFSSEITHAGMQLKQRFGLCVCKAGANQSKETGISNNNGGAEALFRICDAFDYTSVYMPALHKYEEAFRDARKSLNQANEVMKKALSRMEEELPKLPASCCRKYRDLGYDGKLIDHYFVDYMNAYVDQVIRQCKEMFPDEQENFSANPAEIRFGWGMHSKAFVTDSIREASIVRYGKDCRKTYIVKKRKLADILNRPLIPEMLAGQLLQPLIHPGGADDLEERLAGTVRRCEEYREAMEESAVSRKDPAVNGESEALLEMKKDLDSLCEWYSLIGG